jgi:hypothetical protein
MPDRFGLRCLAQETWRLFYTGWSEGRGSYMDRVETLLD